MQNTDVGEFFTDLDGGQLERELGKILSAVSAAVVDHNKVGEVSIKLKVKQIGSSHQVSVEHTVGYDRPTDRGNQTEKSTGITPMYVTDKGLAFFPSKEGQGALISKTGEAGSAMPPLRRYPE